MSEALTETESPEGGSSKQEKSLRYRELSEAWRKVMAAMTVSYTHLTLPTKA